MNKIKVLNVIRLISLIIILVSITLWIDMVTNRINELQDKNAKLQAEINELRGN